MAIKENVAKALNNQIKYELESAYIYLSMAAQLDAVDLPGASHWMQMQAREELMHAMKLYAFMTDRDARVTLQAVEAPPHSWETVLDVFQAALDHEKKITASIDELMDLALSEKDHATASLLRWYVDEQVEEEATLNTLIPKLKMAAKDPSAMLILDNELGTRTSAGQGAAASEA